MNTMHKYGNRFSRGRRQRGIALIWTLISMVAIVLCSGFSVDMSWLYFQRQHAQDSVDAAALCADLSEMNGDGDTASKAMAT